MKILLATGNAHKLSEFRAIMAGTGIEVLGAEDVGGLSEVAEDGGSFAANAAKKALAGSESSGFMAIADDSGLCVDALDGAPGVNSARYAGDDAADADNVAKLLAALDGVVDRRAKFVCAIAIADGDKIIKECRGEVAGRIIDGPRGDGGFGYDPVFVPDGYDATFAELGPEVKDKISHRGVALVEVMSFLRGLRAEGKAGFKPHPLLKRKERRKDKFAGARQTKTNPFINIVEQHRTHKLRVAMIVAAIFALMMVAAGIYYGVNYLRENSELAGEIDKINRRLIAIDGELATADGYGKSKLALRGVYAAAAGRRLSPLDGGKWDSLENRYLSVIAEGGIEDKDNFVEPVSLVDMVYIPAGEFFMGKRANERGGDDELPRRGVSIPYHFWMSRTEVTNFQYRRFFPRHQAKWAGTNYVIDADSLPVVKVSWHQATEFCAFVNHSEKKAGRLPYGYEYRLPTEAEWEYACRAGTESYFYWGDGYDDAAAEFANTFDKKTANTDGTLWTERIYMVDDDGRRVSAPAGSYRPNAFGLYDMSGNVWEWCYDWYDPAAYRRLGTSAPIQNQPVMNRIRKKRSFDSDTYYIETPAKVIRGGSWGNHLSDCRSAARDFIEPAALNTGIGFRLVLSRTIEGLGMLKPIAVRDGE